MGPRIGLFFFSLLFLSPLFSILDGATCITRNHHENCRTILLINPQSKSQLRPQQSWRQKKFVNSLLVPPIPRDGDGALAASGELLLLQCLLQSFLAVAAIAAKPAAGARLRLALPSSRRARILA